MNQKGQIPIKTFQLLHLKCSITNKYLSANIPLSQKGLKKNKDIISLCLDANTNNDNTNFILELQDDTENQYLYYGDLIAIKHFKSQTYVNISKDQKHDENKEVQVYLSDEPEYFVIQPLDEEVEHLSLYSFLLKYINQQITFPFRLLSSDNRNYLITQSKTDNIIQLKGRQKLEFKCQGEWSFVYSETNNNKLQIFDRVISEPIFVETGRKVILRNWWTGFTLHSHNYQTSQGRTQEVTCYSHPRDENDYWCIVKQNSKNSSKFINYDDQIFLQHLTTGKYLNGSDNESYSKLGKHVFCTDSINFLTTQSFDFILEMNKPFTIKFNNYYLAQSSFKAESKIGIQQEIIYVKEKTQTCFWVIERIN